MLRGTILHLPYCVASSTHLYFATLKKTYSRYNFLPLQSIVKKKQSVLYLNWTVTVLAYSTRHMDINCVPTNRSLIGCMWRKNERPARVALTYAEQNLSKCRPFKKRALITNSHLKYIALKAIKLWHAVISNYVFSWCSGLVTWTVFKYRLYTKE